MQVKRGTAKVTLKFLFLESSLSVILFLVTGNSSSIRVSIYRGALHESDFLDPESPPSAFLQ